MGYTGLRRKCPNDAPRLDASSKDLTAQFLPSAVRNEITFYSFGTLFSDCNQRAG